jgi:hypothetical protein
MIQEVSFNYRLLNSTIHIYTTNKCLDFSSWNHAQIRNILTITQSATRAIGQDKEVQASYGTNGLQYEHIDVSGGGDGDQVSAMPVSMPAFLNDNTQSAYNATTHTNTFGISSANQPTDTKLSPYRTPGLNSRHYLRRYY